MAVPVVETAWRCWLLTVREIGAAGQAIGARSDQDKGEARAWKRSGEGEDSVVTGGRALRKRVY